MPSSGVEVGGVEVGGVEVGGVEGGVVLVVGDGGVVEGCPASGQLGGVASVVEPGP